MVAARLIKITSDDKLVIEFPKAVSAGEQVEVELDREQLLQFAETLRSVSQVLLKSLDAKRADLTPEQAAELDKLRYYNPAREAMRIKMLEAGILGTAHMPPADLVRPTEEEILKAGTLKPGAKQSHELIIESRRDQ